MDFYNTKYVCSYNDSDVFLESELEVLNEDEKNFVREALYRRDICNIFNIDDHCLDEKKISDNISKLYKIIHGEKFLEYCTTKISNKLFCNLDSDLELGFMILFSFNYLYLSHNCISEFIETGKISETNESLIKLKKILF
jgi:flagellin-specific chaperone FliS